MADDIQFNQMVRALTPEAETLAMALWATNTLNQDVAKTIAEMAASTLGLKLGPMELLQAVAGDLLARAYKVNPSEVSRLLGS